MRIAVGLVVVMALGVCPAVAAAQSEQVTGFGTTEVGSAFDFYVQGTTTGANPTGHFSLTGPPTVYKWEATPRCMNAAGDRATLGFFIDNGSIGGSDITGQAVLLWVQTHSDHGIAYYKIIGRDVPGDPNPITCADPRAGPDPTFSAIGFGGSTSIFDEQPRIAPGSDSVAGTARACIETSVDVACGRDLHLDLEVVSGPGGENPGGAIYVSDAGPSPGSTSQVGAAVTCLSVSDRVAIIGVTGSRQRFGSAAPHTQIAGLIRVVDAGGPDSGADTFQFAIQEGPRDGPPLLGPTSCSSFPGPFPPAGPVSAIPGFTNEKGNVVVTDTRPLPTSKEQCDNGSWQTFGFDSHGHCVAFVRHQARQECIYIRAAIGDPAFRAHYGSGVHKRRAMRRCIRERMND